MGYYIHKFLECNIQEILDGPRIIYMDNEVHTRSGLPEGFQFNFGKDVEGPFPNLKDLKSNSKIYKDLILSDIKRSNLIIQSKFIDAIYYIPYILEGIDKAFHNMVYKIITHSLIGEVNKREVKGIHLYDTRFVKITKMLRFDYNTYSFEAEIIGVNAITGVETKKAMPSTFFPSTWSLNLLIAKLYSAFQGMKKIKDNVFQGRTEEGILVEFIFSKEGNLKTVYPIIEFI